MNKIIAIIISIVFLHNANSYAFDVSAKYATLIDVESGEILFQKNADTPMSPSSMSKMMTAYIIFDYIKKGNLQLTDKFFHSDKAWKIDGSRMFIPLHKKVSIEDLLKGLIIQSGNDAAINLAEGISGTESDFAKLMVLYASKLGLKNSHFSNATGMPDKNHYSTTNDLAIIAKKTIEDFPEFYKIYKETEFTYNKIRQPNRNNLLHTYEGTDGIKTGHSDDAGYGLTASSVRKNRRLIAVVNGLPSNKLAAAECEKLLNFGFMNFNNIHIAKKNEALHKIKVMYGNKSSVEAETIDNIILTVPNSANDNVTYKIHHESPLIAPIAKGTKIAELIIQDGSSKIKMTYPLVASSDVSKADIFSIFYQNIKYYLFD